jgi:FkbM family methyltransferase
VTLVDVSRRVRHVPFLRRQRWLWSLLRAPYRGVLRRLSTWRGVGRTIDGERLRWRYPFSEFNTDFEAPALSAFRQVTRPGATVLDVGANFGLFTVYAARLVGQSGHVFAFEPSRAADVLADHVELNRVADRVDVLRVMLGDSAGDGELWESSDSSYSSMSESAAARGAAGNGGTRKYVHPMTTLDIFCSEQGIIPDVVKIDVEGAEANVLRGAKEFLAKRHGHIVLEMHPSVLADLGERSDDLFAELAGLGWTSMKIFERGKPGDRAATVHYVVSADNRL